MGNSESSSADAGGTNMDDFDGIETLGYRVLGVQPNSPASAAGLVSFFDFLIGADNQMLLGSGEDLQDGDEYDDVDFPALLEQFKGKTLQLLVWNIKCQQQRLVDIVPNDDWEGAGLLGVTIRLDNYAGAQDRLIRILSVETNSPAAIAGLVTAQDYLLGTTTHSFDSTKVLATVLEQNVDKVVELYVYNTNSDKVRVVALMPTLAWGGKGLLGAEVGTGYLHRLPNSCRTTLGGSVERRVRWIGASGPTSPATTATTISNNNTTSDNLLQQAATLELEPQLEMEPNQEEDEEEEDTLTQQQSVNDQPPHEPLPVTPAKPASAPTLTTPTNNGIATTTPEKPAISVFDPTATKPPITPVMTPSAFSQQHQSPPPSGGVPAPAPYPLSPSMILQTTDPASQPVTITTFIPAAKPPPEMKNVSAEDLFSGPPPVAQIPTKNTLVISSSVGSVTSPSPNGSTSPYFSTPHPPNTHPNEATTTPDGNTTATAPPPPPPPVPVAYGSIGANDFLPPPPKMSGAQQH